MIRQSAPGAAPLQWSGPLGGAAVDVWGGCLGEARALRRSGALLRAPHTPAALALSVVLFRDFMQRVERAVRVVVRSAHQGAGRAGLRVLGAQLRVGVCGSWRCVPPGARLAELVASSPALIAIAPGK